MSSTNTYDRIGPFKYVPENVCTRVAAIANRASGRALDEALRAAQMAGGGYEVNAYRPSSAAVTAGWHEEKHVTRVRRNFRHESLIVAFFTSILAVPAVLATIDAIHGEAHALIPAIAFGICAAILICVWYFAGFKETLRHRRELRTQGFAGDALIDATVRTAGQLWLLGENALVIAWADHEEASLTRTVFYDAVGTITVTVEDGMEGVTVTGRDGLVIGRIAKPCGYQIDTAEGLASEIRRRAELARKAAA